MSTEASFDWLKALPEPRSPSVFDAAQGLEHDAVRTALKERGFCILRNLVSKETVDAVSGLAEHYLAQPAIAGGPGYWKVDHPKVVLNAFVLGGPTLQVLLHPDVIEIIEGLMQSECILADTMLKHDFSTRYDYFPIHSDFAEGWAKSANVKRKLTAEDMCEVVGVGGAFYLHDTDAGAFSYCDATHLLMSPKGQNLSAYSLQERAAMLDRKVRCVGQRGDLVLFDDRGFHGPDFPSSAERRVILMDYFRVDTIGRLQVTPMPIWSTDIAALSPAQLRVAGAGADYMVHPTEHSRTRFRKSRLYPALAWLVKNAYLKDHIKNNIKSLLKRG